MLRGIQSSLVLITQYRLCSSSSRDRLQNVYGMHETLFDLPMPDSSEAIQKIAKEFINLKQRDILKGPEDPKPQS